MEITYRREIDGLRALAVSSVVLYHAGLGGAGFVGVDVFFVISGYLITALLLREHQTTGRIDLLAFYARRARRILPAAMVVVAAVLFATAFLPPYARKPIIESAGWASLFGANVFFQSVTGEYFDGSAGQMPLLHLWSLSVEEQFYFLWPAGLIVMLRRGMHLAVAIGWLAIGSFVLAELLMLNRPEAAFYQMPARFWELAIGGIVAVRPTRPLHRYVTPAGLLLTVAACIYPLGHFPGLGALPAVLGATLLVAAIHGGATSSLLASRPFVAVGLISYSLYLWHWPLLAIDRLLRVGPSPLESRLALVGVAVVLATVSYRFIETPLRRSTLPKFRVVCAGAAAALSVGLCALMFASTVPVGTDPASFAAADKPVAFMRDCFYASDESLDVFPKPGCSPTAESEITLWGDSMAMSYQPMIKVLDPLAGAYTRAGCPPFAGYARLKPAETIANCAAFNERVSDRLSGRTLYLIARWDHYPDFSKSLNLTLTLVASRFGQVIIVGPTPAMRGLAARCLQPGAPDCSVSRAEFDVVRNPIQATLQAVAADFANVQVLDPTDFFCTPTRCSPTRDGYSLYVDAHHISQTAARAYGLHHLQAQSADPASRMAAEKL